MSNFRDANRARLAGQQSRSHGFYAFRDRGEAGLIDPKEVSKLSELRAMVKSDSGRIELKRELAARLGLLAEIGFRSLHDRYGGQQARKSSAGNMWDDPVIKRLATYLNLYVRVLDSFSGEDDSNEYREELKRIYEAIDLSD